MREAMLQAVARAAQAALCARAASIAVLDESARELVFAAACGQDAEKLCGARFRAAEGVAGAVLRSAAPLVVDDLAGDPRFARDIATEIGYVPDALVVMPIERDGHVRGVLEVLDPDPAVPLPDQMALLRTLADQAALAL